MELEVPTPSSPGPPTAAPRRKIMRRSLFGALIAAGLVIAATAGRGSTAPAFGGTADGPNVAPLQDTGLFTQVTAENGQPLTVTVIDPRQRAMAIYHVARSPGEIT